jgi:hypothetical protein
MDAARESLLAVVIVPLSETRFTVKVAVVPAGMFCVVADIPA